jgi:hypothetical protein
MNLSASCSDYLLPASETHERSELVSHKSFQHGVVAASGWFKRWQVKHLHCKIMG